VIIFFTNCTNTTRKPSNEYFLDYYTVYKYNNQGQLIFEINYDKINNLDSLYSITKIEYNNKGQKIKEVEWSPKVGIKNVQFFQYDSSGRLESNGGYYQRPGDHCWQNKYHLNCKNQIVKMQSFKDNRLVSNTQNTFDSLNNIILKIEFDTTHKIISKDSSVWVNDKLEVNYTFINSKKFIQYRIFYDNKMEVEKRIEYDSTGNIVLTLIWDNYELGKTKTTRFIDKNGILTTIALDLFDKGIMYKTLWFDKKGDK